MRIFNFMRYKWYFLGFLTAVTLISILTVFVVGLDFGIDFKGGTRVQVGLEKAASVDEVRTLVTGLGIQEPVVQPVTGTSGTHSYMITAKTMTDAQAKDVIAKLNTTYGVQAGSTSTENVGASFGKETTNRAFIAIAIAVIAIIGYLSFRFEFKFALPAIVALIHDVALTLGIYAATGRLVTYATVAAVLTILGYSVHDTIVVFDRMRENTGLMKRETYSDMVNLSIRQTLVRSINTSVAILLPLVAILAFGGPTLKDFAFALTIGVITGTYSSMFVASPLVVLWKEREPRYRKRLLAASAGVGGQFVVDAADGSQLIGEADRVQASATTKAGAPSNGNGNKGAKQSAKPGAKAAPKKSGGKQTSKRPVAKDKKRTSR